MKYDKAREIILASNEHIIDMSHICELAHEYTVNECLEKDIQLVRDPLDEEETYTQQAQEIFDKHYKIITETLGV